MGIIGYGHIGDTLMGVPIAANGNIYYDIEINANAAGWPLDAIWHAEAFSSIADISNDAHFVPKA